MMWHAGAQRFRTLCHSPFAGLARRFMRSSSEMNHALRSGDYQAVLRDPQTDSKAFADAIWKMIYDQQHHRVTQIYEDLPKQSALRNEEVLLAAMSAYGSQRRFPAVLDAFSKISNRRLNERILFVLIHAATMSDHLKTAEELLFHWLDNVAKQQPVSSVPVAPLPPTGAGTDNSTTKKTFSPILNLRSLFKQWKVVPQYNVGKEVAELLVDKPLLSAAKLDWSQIGRSPIPLHAWATIIRSYSSTGKWRRCWLLLELLEKERQASGLYSISTQTKGDEEVGSLLKLDVLLSRYHFLEPYSPDLLWSLIYHRTLQVMCERYDFPMAALVCDKMQQANIQPEIVAAIHLMKSYHRGPAVLSKEFVQKDFEDCRKEILSIGDQVLENIWKLLERSAQQGDGYHTAKTLAREYVTSLCKLEFPEVAEEFLDVLGQNTLSIRFFAMPELFSPLVHRYSREGDWENAKRVFEKVAVRHREIPSMYHNVCGAMQKAGQLDVMADFMLQYGQLNEGNQ